MAGEAAAAMLTIQAIQAAFSMFESAVKFGSYLCPLDTPIETITSIGRFNFIIVGAGTAGSVLANRLSECPSVSVLLIEAGGCPPIESLYSGFFPYQPHTKYDYDMHCVNDNYTFQNLKGKVGTVTAGKMLGGSSSLHHEIFSRSYVTTYEKWARAANDSSWNYDQLLPYFKKSQNVHDKAIIKKYGYYHGIRGNTIVQRQFSPENCKIHDAYVELGYNYRIDVNNNDPLGEVSPLLQLDDTYRQSGLVSYIYPAKDRPNLHVLTNATVTKVIFSDNKVATGVQFSYNGSSYVVNSINEVIISAGAIKTPQLLMLSGVGPSKHLKAMNIPIVADLPVGKNLQDYPAAVMIFTLENDTSPTPASDPTKFPAPVTTNYINLDNKTANFAQCSAINLVIPHDSQSLFALCLNVFNYDVHICQKWYEANIGKKVLFSYNNGYDPLSRGYIKLNTTDIKDQPLIYGKYFSNKADLVLLGRCLANNAKILITPHFKKIGAEFKDLGLCLKYKRHSRKFWECYGLAMSIPSWIYCGTASMGSVVDTCLLVKEVKGLRVVDASVIPYVPNSKLNAPLLALAEKGAHMIRVAHNI